MSGYPARPIVYILVVGGIIILVLVLFNILSDDGDSPPSEATGSVTLVEEQSDADASRVIAVTFQPVNQSNVVRGHISSGHGVLVLSPAMSDDRILSVYSS